MTDLSPPEHHLSRKQAWALLRKITDCGGCPMCTHGQRAFGVTFCPTDASREFPDCTRDGRSPTFTLKEDTR